MDVKLRKRELLRQRPAGDKGLGTRENNDDAFRKVGAFEMIPAFFLKAKTAKLTEKLLPFIYKPLCGIIVVILSYCKNQTNVSVSFLQRFGRHEKLCSSKKNLSFFNAGQMRPLFRFFFVLYKQLYSKV